MNDSNDRDIQALLKKAIPPLATELETDLWPRMLRRFEERAPVVPWFDWALVALLVLGLFLIPKAIPVLLYHL